MFDRLEEERQRGSTAGWSPGELRKAFLAVEETPRASRDAVTLVAGDIPSQALETARLLTSELVTNSIRHGPSAPATIGLFIQVANDRMRVEVSDGADAAPRLRPPTEHGGHA